jgi:hypothetical protein
MKGGKKINVFEEVKFSFSKDQLSEFLEWIEES